MICRQGGARGFQDGGVSREDRHWGDTGHGERATCGEARGLHRRADAVPAPEPGRVAPGDVGGCGSCR